MAMSTLDDDQVSVVYWTFCQTQPSIMTIDLPSPHVFVLANRFSLMKKTLTPI
jgi:hypothetical protein